MDSTATWSLAIACLGTIGGAFNALLSHNMRILPSTVRVDPGLHIVRPGLLVNCALGALASWGAQRALDPALWAGNGRSVHSALSMAVGGMVVGLVAARWLTNETDKRLLRAAVAKAGTAPAAHPDTVRTFAVAPPYEVYKVAEELMPRHTFSKGG